MIYALLGVGLVGALSSAILAALWKSAQGKLVVERSAHESTRANLLATQAGLDISESGRKGENARLEAVIAVQKRELAVLMLEQSKAPADVRARLEKLSGG